MKFKDYFFEKTDNERTKTLKSRLKENFKKVAKDKYAFFLSDDGFVKEIIAYYPNKLLEKFNYHLEELKKNLKDKDKDSEKTLRKIYSYALFSIKKDEWINDILIGSITFKDSKTSPKSERTNKFTKQKETIPIIPPDTVVIKTSVAKQGLGFLMYDALLSLGYRVVPDRVSVSPLALKVWEKMNSRSDIKKTKIDDMFDPKTKPIEDDGILNTNSSEPDLVNKIYEKRNRKESKITENDRHRNFLLTMRSEYKIMPKTVLETLSIKSGEFFARRLNETRG